MKKPLAERIFEIIPGAAMWLTFVLPVVLSFIIPEIVLMVFIVYAVYWLWKAVIMAIHLIAGYLAYKREIQLDWMQLLHENCPDEATSTYHLMILATYKEELLTLEQSIEALAASTYDLKKVLVVIATEERDHERGTAHARALKEKFGKQFGAFWSFEHPKDLPGEVIGKGGNITFSGRQALEKITQRDIPVNQVLVTTLDADHRVDPQYLASLTYKHLMYKGNQHVSYQPLPMFFNNIWEVPLPMCIMALGSSFWQMIEATRDYRLRNFASHAQPLVDLVETDFWSTSTIVEDGHQYWRSYFAFKGNYKVIPVFVPIYQDAVLADTLWETIKQQYLQKRRWAWGVSDFPYVWVRIWKLKQVSLLQKLIQVGRQFEGNFSWSTSAIILTFIAWIPYWVVKDNNTVINFNYPIFYRSLLTMAGIGMVTTLTISTLLLPPIPKTNKLGKYQLILEWIVTPFLIPFTNIFFSALPAIESQSRLMLGKYLNKFNVTPKKAIKIAEGRHA